MDQPEKCVNRRDFLKIAGTAGAAVGLGAGLGGLVAACGGETTTTTAASATTTTAAPTTTTAGPTTTAAGPTTTAGAEAGREIKIGFVAPLTGPLATFGTADEFCVSKWQEVVKDGWVCGDGKSHPISFLLKDSQSDTNRAAQVAGDLILNDKIDVMVVCSTPETVNPVSDQCETNGIPCYSNDAPWQAYYFGRGATVDKPFKWTYHHFWGIEDIINVYVAIWERLPTNKVVGALWPNDSDGAAFSDAKTGFPGVIPALGYTIVDPGRYQNGMEDFTAVISMFKKEAVEILTGVMIPPDFTNLWTQCLQQGFKPKIVTMAKAIDLPAGYEALGSAANNFSIETQWTPRMQFKSSLTGETCQQIADAFEKSKNQQWAQYLLHYAVFEVVGDALKRVQNVDDKEQIIAAIGSSKLDTIAGPVDFTSPVDMNSKHPVKNVYRSPLVGGQWQVSTKYPRDIVVVDNKNAPEIAVDAEPLLIV